MAPSPSLPPVVAQQDGVVSRAQLVAAGLLPHDLERLVRRRVLTRVHRAVYVDHTGALSWPQRCWAACLAAWPAALHLDSALPEPRQRRVVHVAVDASRRVEGPPGVRVHRVRGLDPLVVWHGSPPRVRLEHAVVRLASAAGSDAEAIGWFTQAVASRRTNAARLGAALGAEPRVRRRRLLTRLLTDLEQGTHSVLEHGYLARVVRPHGLPRPTALQAPRRGPRGREYRDVEHADLGVMVELDGSRWHDDARAADTDARRDLDDLAAGLVVVRLRHPQVYGDPCGTASRLGAVFTARGWTGRLRRCGPRCTVVP